MSDASPPGPDAPTVPSPAEPLHSAPAKPAADTPARARPRHRADPPPRRTDHALPWLTVLAVLVAASIPMLLGLRDADVVLESEAMAIGTSVRTWRDLDALPSEANRLAPPTPRYNGQPLYDRPPGLTWLHLLAFSPLDDEHATLQDRIHHARLASVLFGLLTIAAVFWAGMSIGGLTTAVLASLVCAATPMMLGAGRLATPAMPQAGAALFAMAAALWAVRPFKPHASLIRQAAGWAMCGLALGAAVLFGGVAVALKVLLPLAVVLLICPRRIGNLLALAAACGIAALMIAPWAIHVHEQSPDAWQSWFGQWFPKPWDGAADFVGVAGRRLGWFLLCTIPWTLWLAGAMIQPMSTSSAGSRQRMFVGWGWFLSLAGLLLLLPPQPWGEMGDLLLLLPAAALVVGQVFRQYADLSDEGRHVRYWSIVRFPQLALMLTLSAALPMILAFQDDLVRDGRLPHRLVAPMSGAFWLIVAAVLVAIAGLSMRYALKHHPGRTLACWAGWVLAAAAMIAVPISRGPLQHALLEDEARSIAETVRNTPVAFVDSSRQPDARMLLYSGLTMATFTQQQVEQVANDGEAFYILTPIDHNPGPRWRSVRPFNAAQLHLWHSTGDSAAEGNAAGGSQ